MRCIVCSDSTSRKASSRDQGLRAGLKGGHPVLRGIVTFVVAWSFTPGASAWIQAGQDGESDSVVEGVVYTSLRPPNWDIYLFEEPGAAPRNLTSHPALDYNAVFSPDGRWVVFTSERSGNADL